MTKGVVKWFNNAKGYGFILAEGIDGEIFAHYSAIHSSGYKTLRTGQVVDFELSQGPKGLHALNIQAEAESGISYLISALNASTQNMQSVESEKIAV